MAAEQSAFDVLISRSRQVIPGGVNSPVRAFAAVGGSPVFVERGEGPFLIDTQGRRYIDYVGSWGPLILGHRPAVVLDALTQVLEFGTSFGAPTELELEFAELLVELIPSVDMLRVVNSGTEATMTALRLARGFTGRDHFIKFNGCYHGHADSFLVKAGSGVASCGISGSPGVPQAVAELTASIEFNDLALFEKTLAEIGAEQVAAVIVEPVAGNMGLVLPQPGFLEGLRRFCSEQGIVLIFDEVMSGFRVALGGAQERFGVRPDLTTFGKVIGGGLPVGALGGREDIMSQLAPSGPVYQAGTLSGNPLAMAAGLAQLKYLKEENPYPQLEELSLAWTKGMKAAAEEEGVSLQVSACGAMIGMFFSEQPVNNFSEAKESDQEKFKKYFHAMLEQGIYLAPSPFEAGFISTAHSLEHIAETVQAARQAFQSIR